MTDQDNPAEETQARTAAEWVTFAISLVILTALVALIVVQIPGEHTDPAPTVKQLGIREAEGSFFVAVDVENAGDATAQNVQVLAALTTADGEEIVADQVVDFLAGGETERLEFVFEEDPEEGDLELSVSGYGVP